MIPARENCRRGATPKAGFRRKMRLRPGTAVATHLLGMPLHLIRSQNEPVCDRGQQEPVAAWCVRLLFQALVEVDGDAAVLHAGERPYLVVPTGPVEVADASLTPAAVEQLIGQILPDAARRTLQASGMAHANCVMPEDLSHARFTVTAARFQGDVRLEIHRLRLPNEAPTAGHVRRANRREAYDDLVLPSAEELWPA
jgi:hypothetical protein